MVTLSHPSKGRAAHSIVREVADVGEAVPLGVVLQKCLLKRLLNKLDLPEGQIFALKSLDDIASAKLYKRIQDEIVLFRRKPKDQPRIRKRI